MEMHAKKPLLLLIVSALVLASVPAVSAQPAVYTESVQIQIMDAYYADLDGDGYQDDIKLVLQFNFEENVPTRVDLNIWIELPSGLTYNFRVSVYGVPSSSTLQIDCFDMATESGWYTVTLLASVMGSGNGKIYIVDALEFDPPTGVGGGLPPRVIAYF
jgi:hypothetical protein